MYFNQPKQMRSFFDDDNTENFQLWKKNTTLKKPSDVKIMEGILFKRSTRTNFWKSRYYVLFEDRLAYYKNGRESNERAFCLIQNVRVETISNEDEKDEKYGIRLIHNSHSCELYARASNSYDKWVAALSSTCVLTDYSANFMNLKVIGKGSFAKVYLAKKRLDNSNVAVKTFDKNLLLKQDKAKASLINEINIMRRLQHDNIIQLQEVYESEKHICLVLELLGGGELFDRIMKKGQYTERDACILMTNLLSALECMHLKGMMHRDLKPENLILKDTDNDWNVKLADFGLATVVNPNHDYLFKRCGTPGYVAPEVLADAKYDQKVDVFSCGVILYILLTGNSPFYGKSYNEILWKNKACEISFNFKELGVKVSDSAADLLKKMLARDPAKRLSSTEALEHDWITSGALHTPSGKNQNSLCSAQDNMKRFQEENRFNVKSIKPKDAFKDNLERSGHCPSPLINGHVSSVMSNSPDMRKSSYVSTGRSRFAEESSPNVINNNCSITSTDDDEESDVGTDERNVLMQEVSKYQSAHGYNLMSLVKDNSSSNNSSAHNTPVMVTKSKNPSQMARKAMNIQGSLLGMIKNGQQYSEQAENPEYTRKTNSVKNNLKHFE